MTKCKGCGITLQDQDINNLGYTKNLKSDLCLRCFRIKHYHDYKLVNKKNSDFIPILKSINKEDLVILVVDLMNINKNLYIISKYITGNILLVLTKRDILPLSIYDTNLENYFNNFDLNIIDKVIISSKNNYNYDLLYSKIKKYKTNNIYVVGFTNAGKSSMINKLIYNYTNKTSNITTSILPSTTLNTIEIEFDDFKLIDTPGLLDEGNIIDIVDLKKIKKIIPNSEIKPKIYQIKLKQSIFIEDIARIDIDKDNILSFYISNNLEITRIYKENKKLSNLKKYEFNVDDNTDIVINGLGFIKIKHKTNIVIYLLDKVDIYTRKSLI